MNRKSSRPKKRQTVSHAAKRAAREQAIMAALAASLNQHQKPLTMTQLADRMKISPSTYLMDVLQNMVHRKLLTAQSFEYRGAVSRRFVFSIPPALRPVANRLVDRAA